MCGAFFIYVCVCVCVCVYIYSHPDMCEVISHCIIFVCISVITGDIKYFFCILLGHFYVSFGEMSIQVLSLFFKFFFNIEF